MNTHAHFYNSSIKLINGSLCSVTSFLDYSILDDGILLYLYRGNRFIVCAQTGLEIAIYLLCSGEKGVLYD